MKQRYFYVYILQSTKLETKHYTGFTEDLTDRLKHHNSGSCPHTSKYRPWRIDSTFAFTDRQKALDFERYLKTHSGREFASRHF